MAKEVPQERIKLEAQPGLKRRTRLSKLAWQEAIAGYIFLLPNLIGFLIFSFLPILAAFALTFTEWNLVDTPKFIGLRNFQKLFGDPLFWKTAGNTIYYTVAAVPIGVFIAFWLALMLNRKMRSVVFFRTVFFLPSVTLGVAIAMVWIWLYHPDLGLINFVLAKLGIDGPAWLQSTRWAMPAIIIMNNWVGIGSAMLIYLAGLQAIPEEYYEAARIDGATFLQQLRYITVPLLSPTTFFILVTSFIGAMQGFDSFYVMTRGGPAYATTPLVMYIFQNGFEWFRMGYAAALAAVLFVGIFAITAIQWRVARSWVHGFVAE